MKLCIPESKLYVISEPFWTGANYSYWRIYTLIRMIAHGFGCNKRLSEVIDSAIAGVSSYDIKVEIPSGTVINITSMSVSKHNYVVKFSVPQKYNQFLKARLDYEQLILNNSNIVPSNIDAFTQKVKTSGQIQFITKPSELNNMECEEYNASQST